MEHLSKALKITIVHRFGNYILYHYGHIVKEYQIVSGRKSLQIGTIYMYIQIRGKSNNAIPNLNGFILRIKIIIFFYGKWMSRALGPPPPLQSISKQYNLSNYVPFNSVKHRFYPYFKIKIDLM